MAPSGGHFMHQTKILFLLPTGTSSHPKVTVKRRVSRVESLRNLFFSSKGGHPVDARRRFLLKKRTRSEEKEKVKFNFLSFLNCLILPTAKF